SVTSSSNPSECATPLTFTATVAVVPPGAGTPTGTVTFTDGSPLRGGSPLNGNGTDTLSISSLSVGTHSIVATYSGDNSFNPSTYSALVQKVIDTTPPTVMAPPNVSVQTGPNAT